MLIYKTFRWRIHANTPTDIDTVLNALPFGTMVEGYVCTGEEIMITVSFLDRYAKEVGAEERKLEAKRRLS